MRWCAGGLAVLALASCSFPSLVSRDASPGVDSDLDDVGPDAFAAMTVQEARADSTLVGTKIMLTNVIVTATDTYGNRVGEVWVQQPGGGLSSGISLFGLTVEDAEMFQFRDVVDVVGVKEEFALPADTTGRTHTEIIGTVDTPLTIVKKGNQGTVTIEYVDAAAIAAVSPAEQDTIREKLEGAYVQLTLVKALNAQTMIGQDPTAFQFSVPAFRVQSMIAAFPVTVMPNTCFASIRGVVNYFFDYNLLPVFGGMPAGAGCP